MNKNLVSKLIEKIPKPEGMKINPTQKEWEELEIKLKIKFPPDYKELINCYGISNWGEKGFLYLLHPFCRNRYINQVGFLVMKDLHLSRVSNYPLYPENNGLFPWARTENFEIVLYWQPIKNHTEWNAVLTYWDGKQYFREIYKMSCSFFLYSWLFEDFTPIGFPKIKEKTNLYLLSKLDFYSDI